MILLWRLHIMHKVNGDSPETTKIIRVGVENFFWVTSDTFSRGRGC